LSEILASAPDVEGGYLLLREACGVFPVVDFSVFEMRGEDRKAWLQGQATNDLRQLRLGGSLSFCICAPTGQLLAICTAFSLDDRYLIVTPKACAPAVAERVEAMVIMEDVTCADVTDGFEWCSLQGPGASAVLGGICEMPTLDAGAVDGGFLFRYNRTGLGGWDVLTPKGSALRATLLKSAQPVSAESVEIARLEAGIPLFGKDVNERTLPPEIGPDFVARHISYTKGCYTGQEVLMRIHSRGHTNKTWVGLLLDEMAQPGDKVSEAERAEAGVVTSVARSPKFGPIAAAMVRNEAVAEGTEITVHGKHGSCGGEVVTMPILRYR